MAPAIANDSRISVKKSFLGLATTIVYAPTQSTIHIHTTDYSAESGKRMQQLLNSPYTYIEEVLRTHGKPADTAVGPYRLEVLASDDHRFAAAQLFRYAGLDCEAVCDLRIAEGEEAAVLAKLCQS